MSVETETEVPAFPDAVRQCQDFLTGQNISSDLLWVYREDVAWRKRRILVRYPLPAENERLVESLYERGRRRDLGIRLEVLCLLGPRPCCYVWLPQGRTDAEYALLLTSKFIISVPTDLRNAESVKNPLAWRWHKLVEGGTGRESIVERLPRRNI